MGGASEDLDACNCGGASMPCQVCNPSDREHKPKMPEGYRQASPFNLPPECTSLASLFSLTNSAVKEPRRSPDVSEDSHWTDVPTRLFRQR